MSSKKGPFGVTTAFTLLVSLTLAGVLYAADFRGNNWGDSPEQVKAVEGEPDFKEKDPRYPLLGYFVEFKGYQVELSYQFTPNGKLAFGCYELENEIDLDPFFVWLDAVSALYGAPTIDDNIFTGIREHEKGIREALSRRDENTLIEAVVTLKILLFYRWETAPFTRVSLSAFYTHKNSILIGLGFMSRKYGPILCDSLPGGPLEPESSGGGRE